MSLAARQKSLVKPVHSNLHVTTRSTRFYLFLRPLLLYSSVRKTVTTYPPPPTHTFLKWPFLTDFEKHTHTPPKVTTFWCIGLKVEKDREKCEFAPCWHIMNVPERYALAMLSNHLQNLH